MYELIYYERMILDRVSKPYYMKPLVERINHILQESESPKMTCKAIFNKLSGILSSSKKEVDNLLKKRFKEKKIRDISQARKSIVGNAFSNLFIYTFLKNKVYENIKPQIFVNNRLSEIKGFMDSFVVRVGEEVQRPDADIVVFTTKSGEPDGLVNKVVILSLKTSLRERAGQTYKWKLLLDIATSKGCSIKEKYQISYDAEFVPLICFITANFYDEIDSPQHRGMFKFFDGVFISKPIGKDFVKPLSKFIDFVNKNL